MILGEQEASAFITGYTHIFAQIHLNTGGARKIEMMEMLVNGRDKYRADRALLDDALRDLDALSVKIAPEVVSAIRGLNVKQWVYLKDARRHSIFVDPSGDAAYAVLGLTQGMREILGKPGAMIETGLTVYGGHYVCDCVITRIVWLGPGYRKSFSEAFAGIKTRGAFRTTGESLR